MKKLIEYIARSLVNDPTQVEVTYRTHGDQVNYQLKVAQEDMGRVIGKNGRVANAMRTLVEVAVAQKGKQAKLDIVEPR
ncbi:MAG: KH domain-containing protein [Anaerolineales bacterium]|nr:KH domain-containing protein [Anaerolineales bacterium]